jgi:hypothetical protein
MATAMVAVALIVKAMGAMASAMAALLQLGVVGI